MNAWSQRASGGLVLVIVMIASAGCTKSDSDSEPPPYAASGGAEPAPEAGTPEAGTPEAGTPEAGTPEAGTPEAGTPEAGTPAGPTEIEQGSAGNPVAPSNDGAPNETSEPESSVTSDGQVAARDPFGQMMPPSAARDVVTPFTVDRSEEPEAKTATLSELRAGLTPKQLLDFLSAADADLQLIVSGRSGIENPRESRRTLLHIVKMKLEASRRLTAHTDSDDRARSEGARGELQSLSHLAALGDVRAAEELEELAQSRLDSDDPQVVADSRLVLIGFAIEALQNGDQEAPDRILRYVNQIASSTTPPDVAAMMVMGQARESLTKYGHDQQARIIRDRIIELFADSNEPQIAEMAARLAGNVRFDGIDQLLDQAIKGQTVGQDEWVQAGQTLINESADLQTVHYLAGAAVELEGCGQARLASATYELMAKNFNEPSAATTQEVTLANEAYQARQNVIGQVFSPDLDSVDQNALSLTDYRGKVVLVPFWAMNFPPSLQVLPRLRAIATQYPEQVAIVGVNLDAEGEPVAEFVKTSKLDFRSFRATNEMTNQIAAKFGIVSMPFTAIIDKDGRVADLDFTGKKVQSVIDRLLAP